MIKLVESDQKEGEAIDRVCAERWRPETKALAFRIERYSVCDIAPKPLSSRLQIDKERSAAMKERSAMLEKMQSTRDSISDR